MEKLEELLEWGGIKRDIVFLLLSGLAPVSYTHLDVYKRQTLAGVPVLNRNISIPLAFRESVRWFAA